MARLFVAATLPATVVEILAAAAERARAAAPELALRWVEPARMHLTLVFLGSVDDALRPELAERLGRVASRHPPVAVRLAGPGRFGHRVLWVGVAGELAPLAAGVRRAAERAGVTGLDDRPLRAHLTLARSREDPRPWRRRPGTGGGQPTDLAPLVELLRDLPETAWTVDRFALMSSVLGPNPRYAVELDWALTGRA
ncbi:MAG: RNA 2',3'-cyclic phosphodiesterase [Frankia sp.]|nr:RNA 2',3'-cyclic phosphodiesterase [Frankia sp.]